MAGSAPALHGSRLHQLSERQDQIFWVTQVLGLPTPFPCLPPSASLPPIDHPMLGNFSQRQFLHVSLHRRKCHQPCVWVGPTTLCCTLWSAGFPWCLPWHRQLWGDSTVCLPRVNLPFGARCSEKFARAVPMPYAEDLAFNHLGFSSKAGKRSIFVFIVHKKISVVKNIQG